MGTATRYPLNIGASAPGFKNLPGVDGKFYSLADFSDKKILIIVFSCNHCPYVQAYEERLMALQEMFGPRGVQLIAINANDSVQYPDDSFENMQKRAQERRFNFIYLRDEDQSVAKSYEATHTPHLFVFDEKRTLRYTGKIDDNWQNPSDVKKTYLKDALEALLNGKDPVEFQTFAIGCTIKWK